MKRLSVIGFMICLYLNGMAGTAGMEAVKRRLCESYFRVLNNAPELRAEIKQFNRGSRNPDIMIRELKEGSEEEEVYSYLSTLNPEGNWPDIFYDDSSRSGWQPSFHAERLLCLAKAYRNPVSAYYGKKDVREKIKQALAYWFRGNFRCRNWWYNEIGVPKMLGGVFLLMESEMDEEERGKAIAYMGNARLGRTGQNRVWLAENVLVRALLQNDTLLFIQAREEILRELKIQPEGEGIKPDRSFQQHGSQLQFGNYGLAFIHTMAHWAWVFQDTEYALSPGQIEVLRSYLLEGLQWVVWRGYMDISACGRQLFEGTQRGKALALGKAVRNMMLADPAYRKQYEQFYSVHLQGRKPGRGKIGCRFFPYSDYGVFRSKKWSATVKMSSTRVIGGEIVNSENLRGDYLGEGALFCYIRGDEFRDIFPVWDWQRIPGVSCPIGGGPFGQERRWGIFQNTGDFVGGISDGRTGVMALEIEKDTLQAYKTYSFTGKTIICLGSGIKGNGKIMTSVAQCLRRGKIDSLNLLSGQGIAYYHDGIVYIFPEKKNLSYAGGIQKGNWKRVAAFYDTTGIEKEVFRLGLEHPEKGGQYSYMLVPGVTEKSWKRVVRTLPEKFYRCEESVHFIKSGKKWQVAFFAAGAVEFEPGVTLTAEEACLLMCRKTGRKYQFRICDPTQSQKQIRLSLSGKWEGEGSRYDSEEEKTFVCINVVERYGKEVACILRKCRP